MAEVFKVEGKVTLDTSDFHAAVDDVTKEGKELAEELGESADKAGQSWENVFGYTLGNIIADFTQQASQAVAEFVTDGVSYASSLQEVQNKVEVTFGEQSTQVDKWAKNARTQFGLTELQAKQYASTMGAMLKSMDVPTDRIYEMSTGLAELTADLASFHDLSFDEAFSKVRSATSGETEAIKELGINMTVAVMEAYALKNGITESWQAMSGAEQAVLRYDHMMESAADAQGDFARTSDSYANSMRVLETNINSVKGKVGEALLPALTSVTNWFNSLFEKDSATILAEMAQGFTQTAASLELNSAKAQALITDIGVLQEKQSLTADETVRYKGAVDLLCEIYPELSKYVDNTSGLFTESADVIREEANAIGENLLEKAKLAYQEERLALLVADATKAELDYSQTSANLIATTAALEQYEKRHASYMGILNQLYYDAAAYAGVELQFGDASHLVDSIVDGSKTVRQALEDSLFGADLSGFFTSEMAEGLEIQLDGFAETHIAYEQAQEDAKNLAIAEGVLGQKYNEATEALKAEAEVLSETTEQVGEALKGVGNGAENMADGFEKAEDKTEDLKSALEEAKSKAEAVKKAFAELEQYKLENFNQIKKQVEGVYGTFDQAGKVKGTTASKMFSGMDSQVEQLERFQEAYTQLQEMGAGEDLLSQFEFSPESIGQMEALIKSGTEGITTANEKMAELETKQAEVAKLLSDTALQVDETAQAMQTSLDTLTEDMNTAMTTASDMADGLSTSCTTAGKALDTVQTAGDALGLSQWEPTIDPVDNATGVIASVNSALAALDGKHVYTYVHTIYVVGTGGVTKPGSNASGNSSALDGGTSSRQEFATGFDYVPYDDYAALLHKGEAVLTKAEADNWRKGNSKASDGLQPINVTLNLQGVAQNPYEVADEVRNALELMRWRA